MPRDEEGRHIRPERSCFESLLRRSFAAINYILFAMGLGLVAYSIYLVKEVREKEASAQEERDPDASILVVEKHYWFVELVAFWGVWTVVLAVSALVGSSYQKVCCLGTHTVMVLVALLLEGTAVIFFCVNSKWNADHLVPWDESGAYGDVRRFVKHHLRVSLYIGLAVVILEIVTLLLGCAVWTFASATKQKHEDDEENEIWRRPLLSGDRLRTASGAATTAPSKQKDDPWSQRMRTKYGLDTSKFSYDPEAKASRRKTERERSPGDNARKKCSIM